MSRDSLQLWRYRLLTLNDFHKLLGEQQEEIRKPSSMINAKKKKKKIEENNKIGKTMDLFKKIRDTKGTFHAKMDTMKDRNGMDLTEAEDIKRGGKNTQKNYAKRSS